MAGAGERVRVSNAADVTVAERRVRAVAGGAGFDESAVQELAIVVRELASNVVKHGGGGTVAVASRQAGDRSGIEIRAEDAGPGIADVDLALEDGYSTAGGLGCGLGAVTRLMHDVTIGPNGGGEAGARVVAVRWRSEPTSPAASNALDAGAATRPKAGMEHNGDAFLIERRGSELLVGVIDGLGHGRPAHRAARRARGHVRSNPARSIARLFRGVERACRDTRGVVMALARFDAAAGRVTLGSVGNVSVDVLGSPEPIHVVARRGVLGANGPAPSVTKRAWERDYALVMSSDGLAVDRKREALGAVGDAASATVAARELLRSAADGRDDATALVVKGGRA